MLVDRSRLSLPTLLLLLLAPALALAAGAVGEKAPAVKLRDLGGAEVPSTAHDGKPRIYVLFTTWSSDSAALLKALGPAVAGLRAKGVAVHGISLDVGGSEVVAAFAKKEKLEDVPLLLGDQAVSRAFDVKRFPTTVAIDASGTITARLEGATTLEQVQEAAKRMTPR